MSEEFDEEDVNEVVALAKAKTGTAMGAFKLLQSSVRFVFTDRVRQVRDGEDDDVASEPTAEMFVLQALSNKDEGRGVHYDNLMDYCTSQGLTEDASKDAIKSLEVDGEIEQVDHNVFKRVSTDHKDAFEVG